MPIQRPIATNSCIIQQPKAIKMLPPSAMYNMDYMKIAAMTHMITSQSTQSNGIVMRERIVSAETPLQFNAHQKLITSPYLSASTDYGNGMTNIMKYNFSGLELSSASAPDQDMSAASNNIGVIFSGRKNSSDSSSNMSSYEDIGSSTSSMGGLTRE